MPRLRLGSRVNPEVGSQRAQPRAHAHADPALAKDVGVRQFSTFHDRPTVVLAMSGGRRLAAVRSGMVLAAGPYWASIRAAAQPLFHTARY